VNLENTNAADLTPHLVPEPIDLMTIDVSYSPLRAIIPRVSETISWNPRARLMALVKPMFELQTGELPTRPEALNEAVTLAEQGICSGNWKILETVESPLLGNTGAVEYFVLAERPA